MPICKHSLTWQLPGQYYYYISSPITSACELFCTRGCWMSWQLSICITATGYEHILRGIFAKLKIFHLMHLPRNIGFQLYLWICSYNLHYKVSWSRHFPTKVPHFNVWRRYDTCCTKYESLYTQRCVVINRSAWISQKCVLHVSKHKRQHQSS